MGQNTPFDQLSHLEELRITIHPDNKKTEWGETLIKNFRHLKNLSVLEIHDNSGQRLEFGVLYTIIKKLKKLKNLQRIIIAAVVKSFSVSENFTDYIKNAVRVAEDHEIDQIEDYIRNIFNSNSKLRHIEIGRLQGFKLHHIRYIK